MDALDEHTIRSRCRIQDTLTDAEVEITAAMPDLTIKTITAKISRTCRDQGPDPDDYLQNLVGVRVGPGMLKIIRGLLGGVNYSRQLAFMVEECCHGVILSLTKQVIKTCPEDPEGITDFFAGMVKENVRLYNRCAAFAPGSILVEGITPP